MESKIKVGDVVFIEPDRGWVNAIRRRWLNKPLIVDRMSPQNANWVYLRTPGGKRPLGIGANRDPSPWDFPMEDLRKDEFMTKVYQKRQHGRKP